MTLRQGLQDFRRRHRDSFLLASVAPHHRSRREQERAIERKRQATAPPGASRFQPARSRLCPICEARHGRGRGTVLFPPEIEAIRPILGNAQSRSSSTIIRSMFVSFLAILNNASRNGSEVVCCALMPKAV